MSVMPRELKEKIATKYLNIPTLTVRNMDCLDFHSVSVWSVSQALELAFQAGVESAKAKTV